MKQIKQFTGIIDVLKNMPPDKKMALIKAHSEFHRLKLLCEIKKYIEILPNLSGIKVLVKTQEVAELKKCVDYLKPAGFKWEEDSD